MSKYYFINGLKIRVSDHEKGIAPGRGCDVTFYIKSVDNRLLSVVSQLDSFCEKNNYNVKDFSEISTEWADGSYGIDAFSHKEESENSGATLSANYIESGKEDEKRKYELIRQYGLPRFASYKDICELSEKTGLAKSYIKKYALTGVEKNELNN